MKNNKNLSLSFRVSNINCNITFSKLNKENNDKVSISY